jgi:hypothetical protein
MGRNICLARLCLNADPSLHLLFGRVFLPDHAGLFETGGLPDRERCTGLATVVVAGVFVLR